MKFLAIYYLLFFALFQYIISQTNYINMSSIIKDGIVIKELQFISCN